VIRALIVIGSVALFLSKNSIAATDCPEISDDVQRLVCYDKLHNRKVPDVTTAPKGPQEPSTAAAPSNQPPMWLRRFRVRDDGNYTGGIGKNPASISLGHVNGQDATIAKAALIWAGDPFNDLGWQPFASYGVNRNTLASSATNTQVLTLGATGAWTVRETKKDSTVLSVASLSAREDRKSKTASDAVLLDNYLVIGELSGAYQFGKNATSSVARHEWNLYPRFGLLSEDQQKVKAGNAIGRSIGFFGGARVEYWPVPISDRIQVTLQSHRFRDSSADAGLQKRKLGYTKFSIDYYLYDPDDKTRWLKPIIGLEREVGSDPIGAVAPTNRTTIGLKLLIN